MSNPLTDWFSTQTQNLQQNLATMGSGTLGAQTPAQTLQSGQAPTGAPASNLVGPQATAATGSSSSVFSGLFSGLFSGTDDILIGGLGVLMIIAGIWSLAHA